MNMAEQQTPDRPQMIKQQSNVSAEGPVQRKASTVPKHRPGRADDLVFVNGLRPAQRGITGEYEPFGSCFPADQSVKNQPAVSAVQQDGPRAQVAGFERRHPNAFIRIDKRPHALAAGFKNHRRPVFQQRRENGLHPIGVTGRIESAFGFHTPPYLDKQEL